MNEIRAFTPEIFKSAAVQKHGVVYSESRRDLSAPLELISGNMNMGEYAGDTPLVISQKNYERSGAIHSFEDWVAGINDRFLKYDREVKKQLGLVAIGYPTPVHGMNLLDFDKNIALNELTTPLNERLAADATVVRSMGRASCFAPADCPISNIVDTKSGAVLQIHTGYAGLEKGTIAHTFDALKDQLDPRSSVVYISPHAQEGYVINQVNNVLVDRFENNPDMKPFLTYRDNGDVEFNLGLGAKQRLMEVGIPEDNIQISPDNSLTDPTLYSQSTFLKRGINGRNGMVLGKRAR